MIILFNVIVSWECACACMYICDIRHTGFISVIPLRDLWFLFSVCWLLLPKRFLYRYVKSFIKYVPLVLSCLLVQYKQQLKKMCQVLIMLDSMTKYIISFQKEPTKIIKQGGNEFKMGEIFWIMELMCNSWWWNV